MDDAERHLAHTLPTDNELGCDLRPSSLSEPPEATLLDVGQPAITSMLKLPDALDQWQEINCTLQEIRTAVDGVVLDSPRDGMSPDCPSIQLPTQSPPLSRISVCLQIDSAVDIPRCNDDLPLDIEVITVDRPQCRAIQHRFTRQRYHSEQVLQHPIPFSSLDYQPDYAGTPPTPLESGTLQLPWLTPPHPICLRAIVKKMPVQFWAFRDPTTAMKHYRWDIYGRRSPKDLESWNQCSSIMHMHTVVGSGRGYWRKPMPSRARLGVISPAEIGKFGVRAAARRFRKWHDKIKTPPQCLPSEAQADRFFSLVVAGWPTYVSNSGGFVKFDSRVGTWVQKKEFNSKCHGHLGTRRVGGQWINGRRNEFPIPATGDKAGEEIRSMPRKPLEGVPDGSGLDDLPSADVARLDGGRTASEVGAEQSAIFSGRRFKPMTLREEAGHRVLARF